MIPFTLLESVLILLLLLCSTSVQPQQAISRLDEEQDGYVASLAYDPALVPVPVVQLRVNDVPLDFILDTGSPFGLLMDSWAVSLLKLHSTGRMAQQFHEYTLDRVALPLVGKGSVSNVPLRYAYGGDLHLPGDSFYQRHIASIVGAYTFSMVTIRIDFAAKTLTVFLKPHPPLHLPGAVTLPMTMAGGHYHVSVALPGSPSAEYIVDTGCTYTTLANEFESIMKPIGQGTTFMYIQGGGYAGSKYLLPEMQIGDQKVPKVALYAKPAEREPVLGLNVLSRFRVTLDFPNKELTLECPADFARRLLIDGTTHIDIARHNNTYRIEKIASDSAAAKAGVRQGDILVAIDGHDLTEMPEPVAVRLLDGLAGTEAQLTLVQAGGQRISVHFMRDADFEKPHPHTP